MEFYHPFYKECLEKHSPKEILSVISDFVTEHKKEKIDEILKERISSIHVAMEAPSNIHNALATVRSAEAFGIYNMHIIAPENQDRKRRGRKTTQGAYRWVNAMYYKDPEEFAKVAKQKGILLAGADLDGEISLKDVPINQPIALIFGNEERGLSEKMRSFCDLTYAIPMYGMTKSFNVSVSSAISLYELTNKKRSLGNTHLSEEEELFQKAWYYIRACGLELSQKLLLRKSNQKCNLLAQMNQ